VTTPRATAWDRADSGAMETDPARTAFICAMPMELKPLARRLGLKKSQVDGVTVHTGTLGSDPVVAIVTGMGPQLATAGIERLLNVMSVSRVVVVGITGALENVTPIGTLIRPETVVDAATGTEYRPSPLGGGTPTGKMWTTDGITTDPDVLARLRAEGVVSLDMETAALAAVCERRGIPWSVFRVISDRASDGTIDEEVFHMSNQDGTPNPRAIVRYFLKHPRRLVSMPRMARGAVMAAAKAADAAISASRGA
jgi:adenosylhomocysteine nucleosidase